MATISVYRPDVEDEVAAPASFAPRGHLPARPSVVLVDNGKPKAKRLLELVAEELNELLPLGRVEVFSKIGASVPLDDAQLTQLAASYDLAITGLGDCGACSACSAYDAIELERRGVPSTVVISDVFPALVANFAATRGLPGYHMAVVPHPVSTRDEQQLRALARQVVETVRDQLVGAEVLAGAGSAAR